MRITHVFEPAVVGIVATRNSSRCCGENFAKLILPSCGLRRSNVEIAHDLDAAISALR